MKLFLFYYLLYTSVLFGTAISDIIALSIQKSHTFSNHITYQTASIPSSMLRKSNFVFIVFILVSTGFANGKPQNGKANNSVLVHKPPQPMDQTFNINNWGLGKVDRKLFTNMKYKIDSLYEKSQASQGK